MPPKLLPPGQGGGGRSSFDFLRSKLQNSAAFKKTRDFFGNPEMDMPYKITTNPNFLSEEAIPEAIKLQNRLKSGDLSALFEMRKLKKSPDIGGAGAPLIRSQLDERVLENLSPSRVPTAFGSKPMGDFTKDYMGMRTKTPSPTDAFSAQTKAGPGYSRLVGGQGYYHALAKDLDKLKAGDLKGSDVPKIVRDIANKNLSKKELRQYHPDLLQHSDKFTPEQKAQLAEAVAKGQINLKGMESAPKLPAGIETPRAKKDEIWARKALDMVDPEYRLHSKTQRGLPNSEARDYDEKVRKLTPLMKGLRYGRNAGIVGAPIVGAGYLGTREKEASYSKFKDRDSAIKHMQSRVNSRYKGDSSSPRFRKMVNQEIRSLAKAGFLRKGETLDFYPRKRGV